uniref:uncharacterized protein LOC122600033 isoform X2 n=1 Tax=Erigeron canadensis TaxID=72917 RepID=UPI001CB90428|nr:uncharacterized protein LOC122600033 isoform X2 [Erigeron canadensis]
MTTHKRGVMYVYKLDTGNHPSTPLPTTTTKKKSISRTLGALLKRSKTYKESNDLHHIYEEKEDTKEIVQISSRKSLPTIDGGTRKLGYEFKEGRKTVSGNEERRKPVLSGVEVMGGRRSAENRAEMVMINIGEVASLLQVRVLVTDMPAFMQVHAFRCARQTFDSLEKFSPKQIALNLKKDFDKVYGPAWHCIVGSSFGSFVTHATGCFLYFSMEKLYILVFKTKVQKNVNHSH